jgi:hypothetical protein
LAALIPSSAGLAARTQERLSSHRPCLQGTVVVTIHSLFLRAHAETHTKLQRLGLTPRTLRSCEATLTATELSKSDRLGGPPKRGLPAGRRAFTGPASRLARRRCTRTCGASQPGRDGRSLCAVSRYA